MTSWHGSVGQCDLHVAGATIRRLIPAAPRALGCAPALLPLVQCRVDEATYRRCRPVVTENVRVSALFAASHASLRENFEVVSPELDALVEIAASVPGVAAARMTGAGFGGCTTNLVERDAVDDLRARVQAEYPGRTGLTPRVCVVDAVAGAGFVAEGWPRSPAPAPAGRVRSGWHDVVLTRPANRAPGSRRPAPPR